MPIIRVLPCECAHGCAEDINMLQNLKIYNVIEMLLTRVLRVNPI